MDGLFLSVCVRTGRLPLGQVWSSGCLQLPDSDCLDVTVQHTSDINNKLINIQTPQGYMFHSLYFMSCSLSKTLSPSLALHFTTDLHDKFTRFYSNE